MKDLLEAKQGITVSSPREVLQEAYQQRYFTDMQSWAEALERRSESSHAYDEAFALDLEKFIRTTYAPIIEHILLFFKKSA